MPIGRFSKSCRLTIKALRYYDEVGLLKPAFVDQHTGYRYYSNAQAKQAVMISMLRSMDLSIDVIKKLLSTTGDAFRAAIDHHMRELEEKMKRQHVLLGTLRRLSRSGTVIPYHIGIRDEPDHLVARMSCVTDAVRILEDSTYLVFDLHQQLLAVGRDYHDPVMCINEDPNPNEQTLVHACIGIELPLPELDRAEMTTVTGGPAAFLTHVGPYEELGLAYHSLFAWIQEQGFEQRDAMREIYLNDPSQTPLESLRTEVLLPIKQPAE